MPCVKTGDCLCLQLKSHAGVYHHFYDRYRSDCAPDSQSEGRKNVRRKTDRLRRLPPKINQRYQVDARAYMVVTINLLDGYDKDSRVGNIYILGFVK